MGMPAGIGVIDLMLGIPEGSKKEWYGFLRAGLMDDESKAMEFPAQYMFKDVPHLEEHMDDPVGYVLSEMDRHGIAQAMLGTSFHNEGTQRIIKDHPDRFFGSFGSPAASWPSSSIAWRKACEVER